ncbi:FAD-binding protein [Streptosporangium sp. NPDC023963]|uniref:FAD-binding protein n=1 Tax=Streptosporangium sp. NPDC023963 TaxID=3155608 RepID=UPI00344AF496
MPRTPGSSTRPTLSRRVTCRPAPRRCASCDNAVFGAYGFDLTDGSRYVIHADAVILAVGGHTRIWRRTSSRRDENTGDSLRLAVLAGCRVRDPELVQFYPSGLIAPENAAATTAPTTRNSTPRCRSTSLGRPRIGGAGEHPADSRRDRGAHARGLDRGKARRVAGSCHKCRGCPVLVGDRATSLNGGVVVTASAMVAEFGDRVRGSRATRPARPGASVVVAARRPGRRGSRPPPPG